MKKLLIAVLILSRITAIGQNKLPVIKVANIIRPDVEKVARDYYEHFYNIKGDTLFESVSTIEYQSKVIPQGASDCIITEIKGLHNVYSWEATMLNTEDFDKAVEKYKQIYRQLNGANFVMPDHKSWKFKGDYDAPQESRAFASSFLQADVAEKALQKLKVEVALNYNMPNWTVKVLVYEKEADEDIRPGDETNQ